jgi:hypothetical protein
MDTTVDEAPRALPTQAKVHPPCSVCGNWVESLAEDAETGLLRRSPCGCAD